MFSSRAVPIFALEDLLRGRPLGTFPNRSLEPIEPSIPNPPGGPVTNLGPLPFPAFGGCRDCSWFTLFADKVPKRGLQANYARLIKTLRYALRCTQA